VHRVVLVAYRSLEVLPARRIEAAGVGEGFSAGVPGALSMVAGALLALIVRSAIVLRF
jgi:hypothetical protein